MGWLSEGAENGRRRPHWSWWKRLNPKKIIQHLPGKVKNNGGCGRGKNKKLYLFMVVTRNDQSTGNSLVRDSVCHQGHKIVLDGSRDPRGMQVCLA